MWTVKVLRLLKSSRGFFLSYLKIKRLHYIGIEEIKELAKEKELNNFIKTVNNLILEDIYTRKSVSVRKVYKDKL